ncbi:Protein transport protein SEC24 [Nosema bombycis CQ1]|uniref:Protein transport protein SEC24 n=1 Tax=Nosema bombycis (strain CQ1 / CVCC 102059) TaxID=578461 RepID=R0KNJ5_NOSB1|nr:Protein transport protein SEC24 [Nosema bombycis CQ1]|eukprot:EOB11737.1 Protein transport protein SEC24 [Nosema bombycis CQ1]
MFKIVLKSILENLESNSFEPRAKMIFIFYNSQVMVLSKGSNVREVGGSNGDRNVGGNKVGKGDGNPYPNNPHNYNINNNTPPSYSLLILPDSSFIPFLQDDNFLFDLSEKPDFFEIENLFKEIKSPKNNFGDALKVAQVLLKKSGGSIISFLSSSPNCGSGSINNINDKDNINCKSIFYQEMAGALAKNLISVSYFLFPRINIELPTLSILSKNTGGLIFYYPNFDGEDPIFTTKLHSDLNQFFNLNLSHDCVCRIRTSKDVFIKEYNGSLNQKTFDLLSFPNFYPPHTFSIDLEIVDNIVADGISLQIAMMRTTKKGQRMIRVININIPKFKGIFYDLIDPYSIIRSLSLKSFYYESKNKGSGLKYLYSSLIGILKSYKRNTKSFSLMNLPNNLNLLPMLTLSLCKSIPLRPVSYTPVDYKVYYMYLMSNSYSNLIDTIIYPYLVGLHEQDNYDVEGRGDVNGRDYADGNVGNGDLNGRDLNGDRNAEGSNVGNGDLNAYHDNNHLEEALDDITLNDTNLNHNPFVYIPKNLTRNCLEISGLYLLDTGFTIFFFIGRDCPDHLSNLLFDPLTPSGRIIFDPPKNDFSKKVIDLINDLRKNRFISPFYVLIRDNSTKTHYRDYILFLFVRGSST